MSFVVAFTLFFALAHALVIILLGHGLIKLGRREPKRAEPAGGSGKAMLSVVVPFRVEAGRSGKVKVSVEPFGVEAGRSGNVKVSVVVPFRNEEQRLPVLIGDLFTQTLPAELFEVILVNDHSTDRSGFVVKRMIKGKPGFRVLDLPAGKHGKKEALALAIEEAAGYWILQTDADCRLRPGFLAARLEHQAQNPSDLSAGFVVIERNHSGFAQVFQRLDQLSLAASGAGSFALGRPLMCSGANLLYSRELYGATRQFDPVDKVPSGDDMFLMIGARKLDRKVSFCTNPETIVETAPAGSFAALLRQRIRWGSKTPFYRTFDIQALAILVALTHLALLLIPVWIVLNTALWMWLIGAAVLKSAADFYLLRIASDLTFLKKDLRLFLPVSLLYYPFQFLVLAGILLRKPAWKERQSTRRGNQIGRLPVRGAR